MNWSKFARKTNFYPKTPRFHAMFGRALVAGWRPFVNKVYNKRQRFEKLTDANKIAKLKFMCL